MLVAASHTLFALWSQLPLSMLSPVPNPRSSFTCMLQSFPPTPCHNCLWISIFSFFFSGTLFLFAVSESLHCCMPAGAAPERSKAVSFSQVQCHASCQLGKAKSSLCRSSLVLSTAWRSLRAVERTSSKKKKGSEGAARMDRCWK